MFAVVRIDLVRSDQVAALDRQAELDKYETNHAAWERAVDNFELCKTDKQRLVESRVNFRETELERFIYELQDAVDLRETIVTILPGNDLAMQLGDIIVSKKQVQLDDRAATLDERYPPLDIAVLTTQCNDPGVEPVRPD